MPGAGGGKRSIGERKEGSDHRQRGEGLAGWQKVILSQQKKIGVENKAERETLGEIGEQGKFDSDRDAGRRLGERSENPTKKTKGIQS